jgi:hypothetical protein
VSAAPTKVLLPPRGCRARDSRPGTSLGLRGQAHAPGILPGLASLANEPEWTAPFTTDVDSTHEAAAPGRRKCPLLQGALTYAVKPSTHADESARPYRDGPSRHGAPVRIRQRIPVASVNQGVVCVRGVDMTKSVDMT